MARRAAVGAADAWWADHVAPRTPPRTAFEMVEVVRGRSNHVRVLIPAQAFAAHVPREEAGNAVADARRRAGPRRGRPAVTAEKLEILERRVRDTDLAREQDRMALGVGVALALAIAGLPAISALVLVVVVGRAAVRYVRRELALGALLALERQRAIDLRHREPS
jgi:hypothetical protein